MTEFRKKHIHLQYPTVRERICILWIGASVLYFIY
ncbi:hypothetical protein EZS27_036019, partial [termite gut metagenome]